MIDPTKLRIPSNYILVKPDKAFETYQFAGRETGILVANTKLDMSGKVVSTEQEHISISGTVYAVPEQLVYNAKAIWNLQDNNDFRRGAFVRSKWVQQDIDQLRNESVQFDVPMEVNIGDKVYFEYLAHILSQQSGMYVDTKEGIMMLIKYDMLIFALRNDEQIMLNGFLIIENDIIKKDTVNVTFEGNIDANSDSWQVQGEIRESGLILVGGREEKKYRSYAQAKVIQSAQPVKSYLDFRGKDDTGIFKLTENGFENMDRELQIGDTLLYDPRFAKEIEFGLHRVFSEKKLIRIQRKDVYAVIEKQDMLIV